jgi:hypothetical protein
MQNILNTLALFPLSKEGEKAIVDSTNIEMKRALLSSNNVSQFTVNSLLNSNDRVTKHLALQKSNDQIYINNLYNKVENCCKIYLAKNHNLNSELLNDALKSKRRELVLQAFINPNSCLELKKSFPIVDIINLVNVAPPLGNTVVRSLELLYNNTWLLEKVEEFNHSLKRAVLSYPYINDTSFIYANTKSLRRYGKSHPLLRIGIDIRNSNISSQYLIDFLSPAIDYYLVENGNINLELGKKMLTREKFFTEPNIIARLLNRFGAEIIPAENKYLIAQTRVNSTSWLAPIAVYYNDIIKLKNNEIYNDIKNASDQLGNNYQAMSNFISLSANWNDKFQYLLSASLSL